MDKEVLYQKAIQKHGEKGQLLQAAEECTELAQAIIKYVNNRGPECDIEEEAADVEIMVEQLRLILNYRRINGHKDVKIHRLARNTEGDNHD